MKRVAIVAFLVTVTSCSSTPTTRTLATIPPQSCALLDEPVGQSIPGAEVLRPPFNGTLLDQLLGFFTVDADWDAIVFMNANATAEDVQVMRDQLTGDERVESLVYLDHEAAFADFASLFADQPQIAKSLTAATTPTSFKLKLRNADVVQVLDDSLRSQPGVYSVIAPTDSTRRARTAQFLGVKPRLAALRKTGVTASLLRLVTAEEKLSDRMAEQPPSRIVGVYGVFSEAEGEQFASDAAAVRAEFARDCNPGASS